MTPDLTQPRRIGLVGLAAAVLAAAGMAWYAWKDQPDTDARLEQARIAARKITGREPLRELVARQVAANKELEANIAELKRMTGYVPAPTFIVPPNEEQKGKWFKTRFFQVRETLRDKAKSQRIEFNELLGFPSEDNIPPDADAPELLAMLQLTEKALSAVFAAPDPVESFSISHGHPEETGPLDRPPLLKEYPLTLRVHGSLKTILWILHSYGQRSEGESPLILRGLSIHSGNTHMRDDVQQLDATFELAAMSFIPDAVRNPAPTKTANASGGGKARP